VIAATSRECLKCTKEREVGAAHNSHSSSEKESVGKKVGSTAQRQEGLEKKKRSGGVCGTKESMP